MIATRTVTSARGKALVLFTIIVGFVYLLNIHSPHTLTLREANVLSQLPPEAVAEHYDDSRRYLLKRARFDPYQAALDLDAPPETGGFPTYTPDEKSYWKRLNGAIATLNVTNGWKDNAQRDVRDFPHKIFSTDVHGPAGVPPQFELWNLVNQPLNMPGFPEPRPDPWEIIVANDDLMDRHVAEWVGTTGPWAEFWEDLNKLEHPVLRADAYRYLAMLYQGGVYADSDTAPTAHPFVWGHGAESIVSHKLEQIESFLRDPTEGTLLDGINVVVGIECDTSIAIRPSRWSQMSALRFRRFGANTCGSRSLQFVQYILTSKPHHPIFVDTVQTVRELVKAGNETSALKLTGPGPYTDAVLRYLLVRYGVRPQQLRNIYQPVRVGDVLILQEEAFLSPTNVFDQLVTWNTEKRDSPWYYGTGWSTWRSGGIRVVYHGLAGRWRGQGWD